ncbi:MAG: hypothetical protein QOG96_3960, partial [Pseudonocardiales bacterium]|nr:hypothetical protein [Pseudonocardiales bacterium]
RVIRLRDGRIVSDRAEHSGPRP